MSPFQSKGRCTYGGHVIEHFEVVVFVPENSNFDIFDLYAVVEGGSTYPFAPSKEAAIDAYRLIDLELSRQRAVPPSEAVAVC